MFVYTITISILSSEFPTIIARSNNFFKALPVTEQFVTLGMIATTSRTEDLSTQDYAVFSRLCLTLVKFLDRLKKISNF